VDKLDEPAYNSSRAVTAFIARQGLYGRFKKAKDAKNYSAAHMAEILGKKELEKKVEPEQPEFKSDLTIITSNVSMRDYFAKKISDTSKKVTKFQTASGSGFSLDFQADYYDQMMKQSMVGHKGLGFSRNNDADQTQEVKGNGANENEKKKEEFNTDIKRNR